eukprot:3557334-Prymnesium_polylepis.1
MKAGRMIPTPCWASPGRQTPPAGRTLKTRSPPSRVPPVEGTLDGSPRQALSRHVQKAVDPRLRALLPPLGGARLLDQGADRERHLSSAAGAVNRRKHNMARARDRAATSVREPPRRYETVLTHCTRGGAGRSVPLVPAARSVSLIAFRICWCWGGEPRTEDAAGVPKRAVNTSRRAAALFSPGARGRHEPRE